jgi:hypothetical protein
MKPLQKLIRVAFLVGASLAIAAPAPAKAEVGGPRLAATVFAKRIVRLIGANRYAAAWASLYPLHQKAAPLDRYVACEDLTPIPGHIMALRTIRTWRASVDVAGVGNPVPGTKVALRIVIADTSIPASSIVIKTVSVVRTGKRFAWILPPDRYAAYLAGTCP